MNPIQLTLSFALVACATTVAVQAQDLVGKAAAGAKKNALCVGCHGIQGYHSSFPEVHQVPKLSGQNAPYLSTALLAYQSGERKHPSMRSLAASLSQQDIADLAAYYAASAARSNLPAAADQGTPKAAELLAKGGCVACHGANLSQPMAPTYPKLAGQHADYLYVALRSYKTNDKPFIGRSHALMAGVTRQFSNAELKVLADYIGSLPGELQTLQPKRIK